MIALVILMTTTFQSTPLREGRPGQKRNAGGWSGYFNPRPCARGDVAILSFAGTAIDFNPRPCARGDDIQQNAVYNISISIHAPARGATVRFEDKERTVGISIHAPARGATPHPNNSAHSFAISIHAPARGATVTARDRMELLRFQSTPLREGRLVYLSVQ